MAHPFFELMQMPQLRESDFEQALKASHESLVCVFFWGHQCPNCDIAKTQLEIHIDEIKELGFRWFHVNVYEDFALGTRYGLHGIPCFLFFRREQRLGKISPFPHFEAFYQAVTELKRKHA